MKQETINPASERLTRLKRLEEIKKRGINPYLSQTHRTHEASEVDLDFDDFSRNKTKVTLAGRIRALRGHGGSTFSHIEDATGKFQVYFKKDILGEKKYSLTALLDVGDFIECSGELFRTKKGEKTLLVQNFELLAKSLLPLPEKWHGLSDVEIRYRKRYLDLIANPEVRNIFEKRSLILKTLRDFLESKGFLEVETPVLQPMAGGANAKPFITHHNALDLDLYLRIAPELYLKRLIVGGFEKVYEVARCFRNEGIDWQHNPEFTQIEFYWAYADYNDLMELIEEMFLELMNKVNGGSMMVTYDKYKIDFTSPYPRLTFRGGIKKYAKVDIKDYQMRDKLAKKARELGVEIERTDGRGKILDEIYKKYIRKRIKRPTFIIDHPIELSPLAKQKENEPDYVQRLQLVVPGGLELCNAFTELNDPVEQASRFRAQQELKRAGDEEAHEFDKDFIEALEHGMPPAAGCGIGIDRLAALLTGAHNLREVILFPTLRPKDIQENKKPCRLSGGQESNKEIIISEEARKLGLKTAYAIIKGVEIKKKDEALEKEKDALKDLKLSLDDERLKLMRDTYKTFRVNPKRRIPSTEALISRIIEGKDIYNINTLVDSYNLSSVRERLPMAAYDLSKIKFPIELREAKRGESIVFIGGKREDIKEKEIIYADQKGVTCLDFNYRDCDRTKITERTKDIIIFVDGVSGISDSNLSSSLESTISLIIKFNKGAVIKSGLAK